MTKKATQNIQTHLGIFWKFKKMSRNQNVKKNKNPEIKGNVKNKTK